MERARPVHRAIRAAQAFPVRRRHDEIGVVSDATGRLRAVVSDRPQAVSMSAWRLRPSTSSMIDRSVPLSAELADGSLLGSG
jgi:hypothetical protein